MRVCAPALIAVSAPARLPIPKSCVLVHPRPCGGTAAPAESCYRYNQGFSRGERPFAPGGSPSTRIRAFHDDKCADSDIHGTPGTAVVLRPPPAESPLSQPPQPPPWPALQPPFTYTASADDAQSEAVATGLSPLWKLLLLSDGSVTRHLQLLSGATVAVECLSTRAVGHQVEGFPPGVDLIPGPRVQRQVLLRCRTQTPAVAAAAGRPSPAGERRETGRAAARSDDSSCTGTSGSGSLCGGDAGCAEGLNGGSDSGTSSSSSSRGDGDGGGGGGCSSPTGARAPSAAQSGPGGTAAPAAPPGVPLVYASSWWNADAIDRYLRDTSQPIWMSLSQGHVELYREVRVLLRGAAPPELARLLELPGAGQPGDGGCGGAEAEASACGSGVGNGSGSGSEQLGLGGGSASVAEGRSGGAQEQQEQQQLWGRYYVFWSGGQPLTLIYEVFSPRLEAFLGPTEAG